MAVMAIMAVLSTDNYKFGGGTDLIATAISESAETEETEMANTTDRITIDGVDYLTTDSGLKTALDEFKDGYEEGYTRHLNLLDEAELTSTTQYYYVTNAGRLILSTASSATYNSYIIAAKENQQYTASSLIRFIVPLDENKVPLVATAIGLQSSIDTTNYPGTAYLAVSINNQSYDMNTFAVSEGDTASREVISAPTVLPGWASESISDLETDISGLNGGISGLGTDINGLRAELTDFKDGYEVIDLNVLDQSELKSTTQYWHGNNAGKIVLSTASTATYNSYIVPVDGVSVYTCKNTTRYIYALEEDGQTYIGSVLNNATAIDTSNYPGCKFIAISVNNQSYDMNEYCVSKGNVAKKGTETVLPGWFGGKLDDLEDRINSLDVKPKRDKVYMLTDTSFDAEKNFSDFATSVKAKGLHIVVNPTSFTSLTVGLRNATRAVFYAKVTSDTLYLYDYNGGLTEHTQTYTHGLTIGDNISIDVYAAANTGAYYVRIGTNGTEYVTTTAFNVAPTGLIYPYASMEGDAAFVQFSVDCNTQRPIWLFGDSYHGTNNTARWAYYLVSRGNDSRVMMDSYAGENSTASLASLQALLQCGVPDYIVWCLGMNDGSDSGTTPNSTWLGKIESVIALCEEYNITPILATVPTVPSINNEGKNKWVRESGYQYIDFANAVGASDQGVWFTGMLSSDNIHPSVTGAITLYHAALAGCPQFNQK